MLALSANFTLYGDMSNRMISIAAGLGLEQEIYSIDESFIGVEGIRDMTRRAQAVRERILQRTGVPCGIGIGSTRTLAKLANHVAKVADRKPGSYPPEFARVAILAALPSSEFDAVLEATKVGEIWGIGRRIGEQLRSEGLRTHWTSPGLIPQLSDAAGRSYLSARCASCRASSVSGWKVRLSRRTKSPARAASGARSIDSPT